MPPRSSLSAFSLIELLVVTAIAVITLSILLPSLAQAREHAKRLRCVANLSDISSASHIYAMSDDSQELVPRFAGTSHVGFGDQQTELLFGTSNEYEWGGKGGDPHAWRESEATSKKYGLTPAEQKHYYTLRNGPKSPNGSESRRLNQLIYKRIANSPKRFRDDRVQADNHRQLPVFHCPSDVGVSSGRDGIELVRAVTGGSFFIGSLKESISFYNAIGNSYRANFMPIWTDAPESLSWDQGVQLPDGTYAFTYTAAGREYSAIQSPSRTVIYTEGNAISTHSWNRDDYEGPTQEFWARGWHGSKQVFTASFADGHAGTMDQNVQMRPVLDISQGKFIYGSELRIAGSRPEYVEMPLPDPSEVDWPAMVHRGENWQLDDWPSPAIPISPL